MKKVIHKAETRGHANHGWLNSFHTFSFAGYHNPERMRFGLLRVLNDDTVAAGQGFGTHPHENMEIVSVPLSGALAHKDSTGRDKIIHTGDVQIMSAGTGIFHSEMNASTSEEVKFLQIWIFPEKRNIEPRYEQKTFEPAGRQNKWQNVVSPDEADPGVWINQQAWFWLSDLEAGQSINYQRKNPNNGLYLFVKEGSVEVEGESLNRRDAIGLTGANTLTVKAGRNAELLLMEVPA